MMYVNAGDVAWDAAVTDNPGVDCGLVSELRSVVTLSPSTDFASLAAGDIVTLRIWRASTSVELLI